MQKLNKIHRYIEKKIQIQNNKNEKNQTTRNNNLKTKPYLNIQRYLNNTTHTNTNYLAIAYATVAKEKVTTRRLAFDRRTRGTRRRAAIHHIVTHHDAGRRWRGRDRTQCVVVVVAQQIADRAPFVHGLVRARGVVVRADDAWL